MPWTADHAMVGMAVRRVCRSRGSRWWRNPQAGWSGAERSCGGRVEATVVVLAVW